MNRAVRSTVLLAAVMVIGLGAADLVGAQNTIAYSVSRSPVVSPGAESYVEPLRDILRLELQDRGYQPLDSWLPGESDPLPLVVNIEFGVVSATPRLHIFLRVTDTERDAMVVTVSDRLAANVSLFNEVANLVARLEPHLRRHLAAVSGAYDSIASPAIASDIVFVYEQPIVMRNRVTGMVLVTPEGAEPAEIDFVENLFLPLEVTAPGFVGRPVDVTIESGTAVRLPLLAPEPRWSLRVHSSLGRLAGVGAGGRLFVPGTRWHLTQELDVYTSIYPGAPYFLYHLEPRALVGASVVDRERLVVSAGTGLGAIVTRRYAREALTYLDLYWNLFFVEIGARFGTFVPFLRTGMTYAFATDRGFYQRGINTPFTNPNVFLGVAKRW